VIVHHPNFPEDQPDISKHTHVAEWLSTPGIYKRMASSLSAVPMTETELRDIARADTTGLRRMPKDG
jgi:hypothetical protein